MITNKKLISAVGIILSGTVFSQVINLSSLPILTRMFSPNDFGVLSVFVSIMTICLSFSSLKFEMAIPVQNSKFKAGSVLILGVLVSFFISLMSFFILYIFRGSWNLSFFENYFYFIPIGIFIGGVYQLLNYYAVYEKDYKGISISRIIQSSTSVAIQILLAVIWMSPVVLLIGYIINLGGGIFYLLNRFNFKFLTLLPLYNLKQTFLENKKFPKYTVVESLANTAGLQIPLLLIAFYLGLYEVGYLFIAIKIFQAPIGLISASVSQVFFSKSNELLTENDTTELVKDVLIFLIKFGVSSLIILVGLAYSLVELVFGDDWGKVGFYIAILSPWFILQLVVSPISTIMYTKGYNKQYMLLTVYGLFFKISVFLLSYLIFGNETMVFTLVSVNFLFYGFCFYKFLAACNFGMRNLISVVANSCLFILMSLILSLFIMNLDKII
ncbi:MAG: lipopolysaccharide biosynthesis protein [Alishewanella aestuarii]